MNADRQAYDRAVTLYAPDGSLYQVEYARKAVERGNTSLGVTFPGGFVLVSDAGMLSRLRERRVTKVFALDRHIGCATAGLVGDARQLVDILRNEAQKERLVYGKHMTARHATKRITRHMQSLTQSGGSRPYGVSLLLASAEDGDLFVTSPSGAYLEMQAAAIGRGREAARTILEKRKGEAEDLESATALALDVLDETIDEDLDERWIEIGQGENGEFDILTADEVDQWLENVA